MQLNETGKVPINWIVAISALMFGLSLGGCDRQLQSQPPRPVREVSTVTIQPQKIILTSELPGRTAAYRIAEIRPQVSGIIQHRLFSEGSDVKAGQVLYQIDSAPFQAALDNAVANLTAMQKAAGQAGSVLKASIADVTRLKVTLDLAQTNRRRYEESFKEKIVSATQHDQAVTEAKVAESTLLAVEAQVKSSKEAVAVAEASIQQAEAVMKTGRINLGYTKVSAPISGRVSGDRI